MASASAAKSRRRTSTKPRPRLVKPTEKTSQPAVNLGRETLTISLVVIGLFLLLSLASYYAVDGSFLGIPLGGGEDPRTNLMGNIGGATAEVLTALLGWCSFVAVLWALLLARRVWVGGETAGEASFFTAVVSVIGSVIMVSAAAAFVSVLGGYQGGGAIGGSIAYFLVDYVNEAGTLLLSLAAFILALGMSTGVGAARLLQLAKTLGRLTAGLFADIWFLLSRAAAEGWRIGVWILGGLGVVSWKGATWLAQALSAVLGAFLVAVGLREREPFAGEPTENKAAANRRRRRKRRELKPPSKREKTAVKVLRREYDAKQELATKSKVKREAKRTGSPNGKAAAREKSTKPYELPPLEFLTPGKTRSSSEPDDAVLIRNSELLEKTLLDFKIGGKVVEVQPGPIITLYQFSPAAGVKVQRIVSLADDLALALKVGSVRVYAPVPGKGTVGIEVPNEAREIVHLRDVLASSEFNTAENPLTMAIGKDTFGNPFVGDLARMPHLLIAGATGTGKSVHINTLLLSLLYRNAPEQLKLILIDPKMLELSLYEDIPHLKAPVVTSHKRARGVLWWAVEEMERRYRKMKEVGVRSLAGYNKVARGEAPKRKRRVKRNGEWIEVTEEDFKMTPDESGRLDRFVENNLDQAKAAGAEVIEPLPYIVIVVDELADLMLAVGREIEELLTRLAQKARAAGIHLVLATQRPSVNVITGLIKANFPARISFKVASRIDSRTIIDGSGSEKLLGHGDMLFLSPAYGGIRRLHSAFVSDNEVRDVADFLKAQGRPEYDSDIEEMVKRLEQSEQGSSVDGSIEEEYDPLYDQALQLVVEKGQASTSMIQRKFRIGYNRAARILETMEREQVVGPADGARPREVLIPERLAE